MQRWREGAGQFQHGITENIDDQGGPPPDAIRHPAEEESPERPEGESENERFGDRALGDAEIRRNGGYTKDENEVVKRVQRPAKKTGREGMALPRREGAEWGQKVRQQTPA